MDFNPRILQKGDAGTFRKIVRHELCHYHLYYAGKGYRHGDKDFKDLLLQVNGVRYAPSIQSNTFITITNVNRVVKFIKEKDE